MKRIIQTYKAPEMWTIEVPPGLGDFIRGACHLYEKFDPNLVQLKLDISQTGFSDVVQFDDLFLHIGEEEKIATAEEFFAEDRTLLEARIKNFLESAEQDLYICTNLGKWERTTLPESTRKFIRNFYRFSDEVTLPCQEITLSQPYEVLSIRTGDKFLGSVSSNVEDDLKRFIFTLIESEILPRSKFPIVVMSDCYQLKCELAKRYKNISFTPSIPYHGAKGNVLSVAIDMNLVKNSQFNYHINAWQPWWSGFFHYTSIVFKVPCVNFIFPNFRKEEITSSGTLTVTPRSNLRFKFYKFMSFLRY